MKQNSIILLFALAVLTATAAREPQTDMGIR
jgi:hypothetical protein